jgi:hypothetical protein
MRKTIFSLTTAGLALAGYLIAGGFWLQVGNPEASPEAQKANAVVTLKVAGCHDPATAKVTARAVGTVNGERRSIPLELTKLSTPGMYAVSQQWPKDGKWVIQAEARADDLFTNALIPAYPKGVDHLHAKLDLKPFGPSDIDAMLR